MSTTTGGLDEPTPIGAKDDLVDTTPEVGIPDEERSLLATHADPTLDETAPAGPKDPRARVEWVRASDLATRSGGWALGRGQDLNRTTMGGLKDLNRELGAAIRDAARDHLQGLRQKLSHREMDLTVTSPERTQARQAGREGVSR